MVKMLKKSIFEEFYNGNTLKAFKSSTKIFYVKHYCIELNMLLPLK